MAIKAIAFLVLLKPDEVKKKSAGGIELIIDEKLERNSQSLGTIVDMGPDVYTAFKPSIPNAGLKVGDKVYYAKYAGKWCKDPKTKEELLMVRDEDIVGKYEEDSNADSVVAS